MIRAVARSRSLEPKGLYIAFTGVTPNRHVLTRDPCRRSPHKTDTNPK